MKQEYSLFLLLFLSAGTFGLWKKSVSAGYFLAFFSIWVFAMWRYMQ